MCSECGAPLRWAVTKNGKLQPLNHDPDPAGNVVLTDEIILVPRRGPHFRSKVLTKAELAQGDMFAPELERYMPHHATCPKVEAFRTRARG